MTVTVRTPAKINLGLRVGDLGVDGYHPLATVFQAVSLYDEVKARPVDDGDFRLTVTGEGYDVIPSDDANLAMKAARLLAKRFDVTEGVDVSIHKTIAVAGGLGGGSSDAAGALVACDALWGTQASREELSLLAAELGSDVPFCLMGGNAVGSGRGDTLSPVLARGSYEWVLAYADGGLSTPAVYAELDLLRSLGRGAASERLEVPEALMSALRTGDPYAVGEALHNDLEAAALRLRPGLRHTLDVGTEYNALGSMVSGSGPTCLFLASDPDHAVDIAVALASSGTCRVVQRASGPVHGSRVVT